MEINIINKEKYNISYEYLQKLLFLHNALEDGWKIKKKDDNYIFIKKHQDKKEIFTDDYLKTFLERNFTQNN
jgi:hypothetical protein